MGVVVAHRDPARIRAEADPVGNVQAALQKHAIACRGELAPPVEDVARHGIHVVVADEQFHRVFVEGDGGDGPRSDDSPRRAARDRSSPCRPDGHPGTGRGNGEHFPPPIPRDWRRPRVRPGSTVRAGRRTSPRRSRRPRSAPPAPCRRRAQPRRRRRRCGWQRSRRQRAGDWSARPWTSSVRPSPSMARCAAMLAVYWMAPLMVFPLERPADRSHGRCERAAPPTHRISSPGPERRYPSSVPNPQQPGLSITSTATEPRLDLLPYLFAGRHVLVVGATSGIGAAVAAAFAAHGASVLVTGATAAEISAARRPSARRRCSMCATARR